MWILSRDLPAWILLIIKPCSRRILKSGASKFLIDFFSRAKNYPRKKTSHWYSNKPFLTTMWHKHRNRSNKEVLIFKITFETCEHEIHQLNRGILLREGVKKLYIPGQVRSPNLWNWSIIFTCPSSSIPAFLSNSLTIINSDNLQPPHRHDH